MSDSRTRVPLSVCLFSILILPTCIYCFSTSLLMNFEISELGKCNVFRTYREKSVASDEPFHVIHVQIPRSNVMTIPGSRSAASDVH